MPSADFCPAIGPPHGAPSRRSDTEQISCRARLAFGCWLFGSLASTFAVLWTLCRHRHKVHKTANLLNKVARSVQVNMKADLREIYGASTRAAAETAIDVFADKYGAKYEKAVACLTKDREALLAFFDFPAEHWDHLRTSNPIESVFATVRHRTVRTKGALSATTAKLMVFKLVNAAAKTWRRLKGENQLPKVVRGVKFQNGIEVIEMPAHHAA